MHFVRFFFCKDRRFYKNIFQGLDPKNPGFSNIIFSKDLMAKIVNFIRTFFKDFMPKNRGLCTNLCSGTKYVDYI